jgi:hypothetical protein
MVEKTRGASLFGSVIGLSWQDFGEISETKTWKSLGQYFGMGVGYKINRS